jgi:hypothetical protein
MNNKLRLEIQLQFVEKKRNAFLKKLLYMLNSYGFEPACAVHLKIWCEKKLYTVCYNLSCLAPVIYKRQYIAYQKEERRIIEYWHKHLKSEQTCFR